MEATGATTTTSMVMSQAFFTTRMIQRPLTSTIFPYTTLFRSFPCAAAGRGETASRDRVSATIFQRACFMGPPSKKLPARSEEHTSELQSRLHIVCRLLLEKKKQERHLQQRWFCHRRCLLRGWF